MIKISSGQTCLRQILKANHCSMERQIVRGMEMTSFGHAGSRVNLMYKSVALETDNKLQEIIRFLTLHLVEKVTAKAAHAATRTARREAKPRQRKTA